MRIVRLQANGIKRLVAVDITPEEGMNRVGGFNAHGKTSLLDSIKMALGGADEIPMKPLRSGEEYGAIRVTVGDGQEAELIVTRYFNDDGTTSLKVTNGEGATYDKGQTKLSSIIGAISFDPVRFADMSPDAQFAELRRLVPLAVDLDDLAAKDKADVAARRDINRDAKALQPRIAAIEVSGIVPEEPDRDAILSALSTAGETNAGIERERAARRERQRVIDDRKVRVGELSAEFSRLEDRMAQINDEIMMLEKGSNEREVELAALPLLDQPLDTAQLSADLAQADRDLALLGRIAERKRLQAEFSALEERSKAFTKALADRNELREKALAEAPMPIEGLSFGEVDGKMVVTFNGEPFAQASRAEQIRVSMRIAMASNPKLRVMTIRDGSLIDPRGFALISEIAAEGGYQVFVEVVGDGDENGIIIEDGRVKGAPEPEVLPPPKRRKKAGETGQITATARADIEAGEMVQRQDDGTVAPYRGDRVVIDDPHTIPNDKPAPRKPRYFTGEKGPSDLFGKS